MIITLASQYGLISVGYIALHQKENQVTAPMISEKFNIPLVYLQRILTELNKAGILLSKRGPNGGQVLARVPEKISLLEIIRAIEGSTFDPFNFLEDKPNEPFLVKMKEVSDKANSEIKRILSQATLADMIGSKKK